MDEDVLSPSHQPESRREQTLKSSVRMRNNSIFWSCLFCFAAAFSVAHFFGNSQRVDETLRRLVCQKTHQNNRQALVASNSQSVTLNSETERHCMGDPKPQRPKLRNASPKCLSTRKSLIGGKSGIKTAMI